MQKRNIAEGITLHLIPDPKFKNCIQAIFFRMPLRRETATSIALIPKLLTAGSAQYKDKQAVHMALENMYGARLSAFAEKIGETHIVGFMGDTVADCYTEGNPTGDMLSLLKELICNPKTEGDGFQSDIFEREKAALLEDIEGAVNDKRRYALLRCVEEMCAEEAYGIRAEGVASDLDQMTAKDVFAQYKTMLKTAQIDIFVAGAFDVETAEKEMAAFANIFGGRNASEIKCEQRTAPEKVRYVRDKEPVQQGKLVIGYRTDVDPLSDASYALMVYNGVFGGGTSSKLFNEVREKRSLCYYASSGQERVKGLLFVQSGIEFANYTVTLQAIEEQAAEILAAHVSEAELSGAKNGIQNRLRSYKDSPSAQVRYYMQQLPLGVFTDIDTVIKKVAAVSLEDVCDIAKNVHMDTVYFLDGEGGKE